MAPCTYCNQRSAVLKRPKTGAKVCKECFFEQLELEVHQTITSNNLFQHGEKVAIAASGGKDSTVLAHILTTLNTRYNYGLDLFLLSIDEGITGYRDDSLETVKQNQRDYQIPLKIVSYKELYGWTMDEIVRKIGKRNNCTYCGVFRRQALDRGALLVGADKLVTGHNADDIAETVLMNILRGDHARLDRCVSIVTGDHGNKEAENKESKDESSTSTSSSWSSSTTSSESKATTDSSSTTTPNGPAKFPRSFRSLPRCKPFKYTYEKEIVLYAYHKQLVYFSTECLYAPEAYRGYTRALLKDLEDVRKRSVIDIIRSAEHFYVNKEEVKQKSLGVCQQCGYLSSNNICKACSLLAILNNDKEDVVVNDTVVVVDDDADIDEHGNIIKETIIQTTTKQQQLQQARLAKKQQKQQQRQQSQKIQLESECCNNNKRCCQQTTEATTSCEEKQSSSSTAALPTTTPTTTPATTITKADEVSRRLDVDRNW